MGVGNSIGFCARYSQNASIPSFNYSHRKIHIALMGDPTLTFRPVVPAESITATETPSGIELSWQASEGDFDGYNLYRIDDKTHESTKVNSEIIAGTNYVDIAAPTGKFFYQLRTVKLEKLANSSYYAMGLSSSSNSVNYISSVDYSVNDGFFVAPNPSYGMFRLHLPDGVSFAEGISIQDLTGRVMLKLEGRFDAEKTINAKLPIGTYILVTQTNKGQLVEKIQIVG
jgi:hypothetical protein